MRTLLFCTLISAACHSSQARGTAAPQGAPGEASSERLEPAPWEQLRERLPELAHYRVATTSGFGNFWDTEPVFLAVDGSCIALPKETAEDGSSTRGFLTKAVAIDMGNKRCTREVSVNDSSLLIESEYCVSTVFGGEDWISEGAGGDTSEWGVYTVGAGQVTLGARWALAAEAETILSIGGNCSAESLKRVTEEVSGHADPTSEMMERFGVFEGVQRCQSHEGIRLSARRARDVGSFDRGARGRTLPDEVDCRTPCPSSPLLAEIDQINAALAGHVFVKADATERLFLTHGLAHCEELASQATAKPFELRLDRPEF